MPKKAQEKTTKAAPATKSKAIKKDSAKEKVTAAKKAVVKKENEKIAAGKKFLDLGLIIDCTSSMYSWIDRAKETLKTIIDNVMASCDGNLKVRVSFVGYRDHCDKNRFAIKGFTEDIQAIKEYIQATPAEGGGDAPEDVVGGLRKCLD